jgi:hypothetical protein
MGQIEQSGEQQAETEREADKASELQPIERA